MLFLIQFILAVFGLSYITSEAFITKKVRDAYTKNDTFGYLLNCIKCQSFWNTMIILGLYTIHPWVIFPFIAVGSVHIIKSILPNNIF